MKDGRVKASAFVRLPEIRNTFSTFYLSRSRFSEDVITLDRRGMI